MHRKCGGRPPSNCDDAAGSQRRTFVRFRVCGMRCRSDHPAVPGRSAGSRPSDVRERDATPGAHGVGDVRRGTAALGAAVADVGRDRSRRGGGPRHLRAGPRPVRRPAGRDRHRSRRDPRHRAASGAEGRWFLLGPQRRRRPQHGVRDVWPARGEPDRRLLALAGGVVRRPAGRSPTCWRPRRGGRLGWSARRRPARRPSRAAPRSPVPDRPGRVQAHSRPAAGRSQPMAARDPGQHHPTHAYPPFSADPQRLPTSHIDPLRRASWRTAARSTRSSSHQKARIP